MAYTFPNSDLQNADALLNLLGSFWSTTYGGNDVVQSLLAATAKLYEQAQLDLLETVASLSRLDMPVFHRENWSLLTLKESEVNGGDYGLIKFDGTEAFAAATSLRFGEPVSRPLWAWKLPDDFADVNVIFNRITGPSLTLTRNVDFVLTDGYLVLRENPFDNHLVAKRTVLKDNVAVDRECGLWLFHGMYDKHTAYNRFGYALSLQLPSSENYKLLINAVMDALTQGTTGTSIRQAWSAISGIPIIKEPVETVELVLDETDRQLVITDKNVYAFTATDTITAEAGDTLHAGDTMSTGLQFFEFNAGQNPGVESLPALALSRGFLTAGYYQDLIFENKDVTLVTTTDDDGRVKVSWHLGGWPSDVAQFFDELHARGVAEGQTLAHLLDRRPAAARDGEPPTGALPPTINPLDFLIKNILRANAFVVRVTPSAFGETACGIEAAKVLRKIIPPHTAMLVLTELVFDDQPVKMEAAGDATAPGYQETFSKYLGTANTESMLGPAVMTERVSLKQIGGHCV